MKLTPIERLLAKSIHARNGCLLYRGQLDKDGYGRVGSGVGGTHARTHRLSYIHFKGPIPNGMYVCHTCDTPSCVNPDHLFLGTALDNNRDRDYKGRGADITEGKNPQSKLSDTQVQNIHQLFKDGNTMTAIAAIFGIGMQNVSLIVRGITRPQAYEAFHGSQPVKATSKPRLSDEQVSVIRNAHKTCAELAVQFNISTAQVSRIRNGKRSGSTC